MLLREKETGTVSGEVSFISSMAQMAVIADCVVVVRKKVKRWRYPRQVDAVLDFHKHCTDVYC